MSWSAIYPTKAPIVGVALCQRRKLRSRQVDWSFFFRVIISGFAKLRLIRIDVVVRQAVPARRDYFPCATAVLDHQRQPADQLSPPG
jgi:hypothetical protein